MELRPLRDFVAVAKEGLVACLARPAAALGGLAVGY